MIHSTVRRSAAHAAVIANVLLNDVNRTPQQSWFVNIERLWM
jgi:hypothetical protein